MGQLCAGRTYVGHQNVTATFATGAWNSSPPTNDFIILSFHNLFIHPHASIFSICAWFALFAPENPSIIVDPITNKDIGLCHTMASILL
jgi:hypothetical protein